MTNYQLPLTNSEPSTPNIIEDIQEPITSASPEVREIIERVLQLEKDKLYLKAPRYINDDILTIIKDVVR